MKRHETRWGWLWLALVTATLGCSSAADSKRAADEPGPDGTGGMLNAGGAGSTTLDPAGDLAVVGAGGASAYPGAMGTGGYLSVGSSGAGGASNTGDQYDAPGTNPFVITAHDPLSTFAADVDTASYDIFRRDVQLGMLPQPDSVRLEEYVNYFHYDYPPPAADSPHPFAISLAASPDILQSGTTLLRVGIQGVLPPPFVKKPVNLVYLVDVSGSMQSADKLPLAQHLLEVGLDVLEPTDTVAIVSYASDTRVRLPPTPVSERSVIVSAIDGLTAGGSTAGSAGLALAYQQAQAGFIDGGINHVVLCTDGDFNVGPSTTDELLAQITEQRKSGITLTALGFGVGNLNDAMMEAVSNAGNGIYSVISSEAQAESYASTRLLATIEHIAQDMKIQVEFNPDEVYAYRLLGYENRAIADQDFRNDVVDAGEIGAGHQVTALYQLVLPGGSIPLGVGSPTPLDGASWTGVAEVAAGDLALVKVRYKVPGATETDPAFEVSSSLPASAATTSFGSADASARWAISVAAFAEILKHSPYADTAALPTIADEVAAQADTDADRAEFAELFTTAHALLGAD